MGRPAFAHSGVYLEVIIWDLLGCHDLKKNVGVYKPSCVPTVATRKTLTLLLPGPHTIDTRHELLKRLQKNSSCEHKLVGVGSAVKWNDMALLRTTSTLVSLPQNQNGTMAKVPTEKCLGSRWLCRLCHLPTCPVAEKKWVFVRSARKLFAHYNAREVKDQLHGTWRVALWFLWAHGLGI